MTENESIAESVRWLNEHSEELFRRNRCGNCMFFVRRLCKYKKDERDSACYLFLPE